MASKKRKTHKAKSRKTHGKKSAGLAGITKRVAKLEHVVKKSGLADHYS